LYHCACSESYLYHHHDVKGQLLNKDRSNSTLVFVISFETLRFIQLNCTFVHSNTKIKHGVRIKMDLNILDIDI
jgi:hypothetical protein